MNKKRSYWLFKDIIFLIILFFLLFLLIIVISISSLIKDEACKEIKFIDYRYINRLDYCEDIEGNLHYIKLDCENFEMKCKAKEISIGGVRLA